ncbi:MAG TPA: TVP38/TMEM64 family protein [Thermoanaerobaculia bacterium]|nr:TVP38/TMEM64 family protein [Thermoanaerobaculia bacterium]
MRDRRLWRGVAVLLTFALIGVAVWFSPLRQQIDLPALVAWARAHRGVWWVLPAYFAAYAVLTVLFIPTQALSVTSVVLWGWSLGGLVELLAATTGSVFPYLIARGTLRESIAARLERHRAVSDVLEREGFTLLLVLRVVPILPFSVLNYAAGLTSLRLWQYVVATLFGMIPATFTFAYFVHSVLEGVMEPRQVVVRGLIAGTILAALIIATRLAAPRVRRWLESRVRTS